MFIDRVHNAETARQLALQDWEGMGIALVVAGYPDAARAFSDAAHARGVLYELNNFNVEQQMRYLSNGANLTFYAIPGDIRDTLRRPLLARLYRKLVRETLYQPKNEYELYDLSLKEVFRTANAEERLAKAPLYRLALEVLAGGAYPWSSSQVELFGMTQSHLGFLLRHGALHEADNDMLRIWHDRLLNWVVAQALVTAWQDGRKTADDVVESVTRIWQDSYGTLGRLLGYVPMDVFWLLARASQNSQVLLNNLLAAMENAHPLNSQAMYSELLPPIGEAIVPALVRRMEARTADDQWAHIRPIALGVAAFTPDVTTPVCLRLLQSGTYSLLSAACEILKQRPAKEALELLWMLLQDIHNHEDKYQKPDSSWALAQSFGGSALTR